MIIGICGGTGSGKTTIARDVVRHFGAEEVVLLDQDSYYRNLAEMPLDARHQANFDHPEAIDFDLLVAQLEQLKRGVAVDKPVYDFRSHVRTLQTKLIEPKPVTVIEGILIFAEPRILDLLDLRVFVDTSPDIRFIRRLQRDIAERGRTPESVIEQYLVTVRPMHFKYIEPTKQHADLVVPDGGRASLAAAEVLCALIRGKLNNER